MRPNLHTDTMRAMKKRQTGGSRYEEAGVSIHRANQLVERISDAARTTYSKGVISDIGGFGAMFDLSVFSYRDPILVSGTDGVGTKIRLAIDMGVHDTIGIDLVAMCVNDVLVQGASPLFFLDYFACSHLDVDVAAKVIEGIARGCRLAECSLVGGETAEMPGMYPPGDYDLAGFCVGAVERDRIIDGRAVSEGDVLIGIASSGPHSNGYSLIRKILRETNTTYDQAFDGRTIGEVLLAPTLIYVRPVRELISAVNVKALAHITGGGLLENIPRVLPDTVQAVIENGSWQWPPVFRWLQDRGNIDSREMYRTFNCGIGMVACVGPVDQDAALDCLRKAGQGAWPIGCIAADRNNTKTVRLAGL